MIFCDTAYLMLLHVSVCWTPYRNCFCSSVEIQLLSTRNIEFWRHPTGGGDRGTSTMKMLWSWVLKIRFETICKLEKYFTSNVPIQ